MRIRTTRPFGIVHGVRRAAAAVAAASLACTPGAVGMAAPAAQAVPVSTATSPADFPAPGTTGAASTTADPSAADPTTATTTADASTTTAVANSTATDAGSTQPGGSDRTGMPQFLSLTIDTVTPEVVRAGPSTGAPPTSGPDRAGSAPMVTVTGTVRNVGDRDVSDVEVRLQRAQQIDDADEVRSVLNLDQSNYGTVGLFHPVADSLARGQSAGFSLSLPLNDPATRSLAITEPGVYPLLVNVNGTPDYGGRARLDDARFLLPVLSLPAGTAPGGDARPQGPVAPSPVPVTMLYPLTAAPELAAGQPGPALDSPSAVRLVDDSLPRSLASGGRLHGVLTAARQALTPAADPHGALAAGLCLAVDPDLLVTVDAMTRGFEVAKDPADPDSDAASTDRIESEGQAAAAAWLKDLRQLASQTCTVALPYAQADLDAVRKLASPRVTGSALAAPADIVDGILGVKSVRSLVWPSVGQLAPETLATVTRALAPAGEEAGDGAGQPADPSGAADGPSAPPTVLVSDNSVDTTGSTGASGNASSPSTGSSASSATLPGTADAVRIELPTAGAAGPDGAGAPPTAGSESTDSTATGTAAGSSPALLFDMPTSAALAAVGARPSTPAFVPADLRFDVDHDSRTARLQDAMGAMAWPLLEARRSAKSTLGTAGSGSGSRDEPAAPPAPLLIAPPQDWTADHDEAAALLGFLQQAYRDGLAAPRPLTTAFAAASAPGVPSAELTDPYPGDGIAEGAASGPAGTGTTSGADFGFTWNTDRSVPESLLESLRGQLSRLATLDHMLAGNGPDGETPEHYITPLYRDVLRAVSTWGRGGDGALDARAAADGRSAALTTSLTDQFDAVTVVAPGSVYTLASSQSPLLVVAKNDLAMPVNASLRIRAPEGVQIGQADDYVIPARGSRQIQVPAQIEFSRQMDLRVQLLAPDSTPIGEQIHISLHSNAYGMVIPVVTGLSGALLLFLAGRRGWHRLRGQHDRADDRASERGPVLEQYRRDGTQQGPEDEG
ncbi:glycoprotein [Tomitella fengzijianii]|uniref:Glycoprotein n=1 Tax=Tomitella fengzijianii TaxID=2597660 RepID=A0A516X8A3_9ACTN|nr:glycoprotein [Tomitella fengzijianii]QDQ98871.1 glycoprotein [Tomitella fengzijianii]